MFSKVAWVPTFLTVRFSRIVLQRGCLLSSFNTVFARCNLSFRLLMCKQSPRVFECWKMGENGGHIHERWSCLFFHLSRRCSALGQACKASFLLRIWDSKASSRRQPCRLYGLNSEFCRNGDIFLCIHPFSNSILEILERGWNVGHFRHCVASEDS